MSVHVLMMSPGFPPDLSYFTQALAAVGARVYGIGDQPLAAMSPELRAALTDYRQVRSLWDAPAVIAEVESWLRGKTLDRAECLWEPGVEIVARLRERFGLPGLNVEQSVAFRDKVRMKEVLDAAGVRTPKHARARTRAECRDAAARFGYPLIIKPIAGAGAADTFRLDGDADLELAFRALSHVPEVAVEEFIEGEEYTFDTICVGGEIRFHNVTWYRPNPLVMRQNPWISPVSITLADTTVPHIQVGVELGRRVIRALGFATGITHMEWFRNRDGEAIFGEIGGRAPGGRLVHAMNHATGADVFAAWAEAVCYGRVSQDLTRRYNVGIVFKRAEGTGRIQRIEGLGSLLARFGEHIVHVDINRIGAPRRDYREVVEGDGWIVCRHPDLETTIDMTDHIATDLRMYAG